ncbi:hypothetical protein [Streptomyces litchfieldiae]|uniref:Uncharacterized protein n=1 Tax=Streptomyces litchfieldiae TaxID=3075543 RepID=A0ABU2N1Y5_9ACTN|nr:hypothetical protein [Streptomyces sp. DSM 44938]MDT0347533.1 hypothetical protein [Streptomyces sp. DSM 44938]
MPADDFDGITGLERELIPVRPPAPGRCPPTPITPERAAVNRAVLEAAIRRPTGREAAA